MISKFQKIVDFVLVIDIQVDPAKT